VHVFVYVVIGLKQSFQIKNIRRNQCSVTAIVLCSVGILRMHKYSIISMTIISYRHVCATVCCVWISLLMITRTVDTYVNHTYKSRMEMVLTESRVVWWKICRFAAGGKGQTANPHLTGC